MRLHTLFSVLFGCYGLVSGRVFSRNFQLHEARDAAPSGFVLSGPADSDATIRLRIALVQNNVDGLVDALYSVSDPTSESYGQHLSRDEVASFVAPASESTSAVQAWLNENGLNADVLSPGGDWLGVDVPSSTANDLLSANFSVFTHEQTGLQTIRTLAYSIPAELTAHIDFVHPTTTFPSGTGHAPVFVSSTSTSTSPVQRSDNTSAVCGSGNMPVTPWCLQYIYNIPSDPANSTSNGIAVTAYGGAIPQESDLQRFLTEYRPDMSNSTTFTFQSVNGGNSTSNNSQLNVEANLDVQYAIGLATGVPVTFLSVGGEFDDALLDTANYLLSLESPPPVVATSYGDNENAISQKLAYNLCNAYAQLGARGVSVIFASGDGGVSGNKNSECTTFVPTFPSGCPYVTSVGATTLLPNEQAAAFSSGGFSNYWPQPSYQSAAVSAFLTQLGGNSSGLYNASGRAFPDVAAYGTLYDIYNSRAALEVSGTSAAVPTVASIVALLNDRLLTAGRATLGWLNPWLYGAASGAFASVTAGNNLACSGGTTGFYATSGWDPITGLGTPDFDKLLTAAGL
ncbi:hypothetical protein POSPLADRAFT_1070312 [Postia placenta MAD-698-R-SB12]|uniref:tripeptidyl-peptidase II n=1 Tax=Postia placenta MAD-698-R-SB12 TaxID=670580 RepID=A0A1X6MZ76_9APHY|nr:hypothetical protein POSPLADRAFT_1070312 [Postia placenta MAD-698-R-SB12]OSX61674.1 hypothetical protein POSPLADRAFT_1070312 [Postia placenta MAD-698-R-SB12]